MGAVEIGLAVPVLSLFYAVYRMCRSKKPDPKMEFLLGLIERCADKPECPSVSPPPGGAGKTLPGGDYCHDQSPPLGKRG